MYLNHGDKDEYQFEESNEKIGAIFVRHPLLRAQTIKMDEFKYLPKSYATEDEVAETIEGFEFYESYIDFQKTHHSIHAIEAFVKAFKAGIYPPVSVQEVLAKGFKDFLDSAGEKPLGSAFGFKNNRTSARRYLKNLQLENRNSKLVFYIAKLHYLFPQISHAKVFSMLSEAIDEEIRNKSIKFLRSALDKVKTPLSPDALKKIFEKSGEKEEFNNGFKTREKWGNLDTSVKAKMDYLSQYPYKIIPQELKDLHPEHNKPPSEKYMGRYSSSQ